MGLGHQENLFNGSIMHSAVNRNTSFSFYISIDTQ